MPTQTPARVLPHDDTKAMLRRVRHERQQSRTGRAELLGAAPAMAGAWRARLGTRLVDRAGRSQGLALSDLPSAGSPAGGDTPQEGEGTEPPPRTSHPDADPLFRQAGISLDDEG
jgi:hypothetical protein